MAAAAHDIGRAEHDEITGVVCRARGFLVDWKFGDPNALCAKCLTHRRTFIVMRQHSDAGVSRRFRQPRDRCRDVVTAGNDACYQTIERLARKTSAFDDTASFLRLWKNGLGWVPLGSV